MARTLNEKKTRPNTFQSKNPEVAATLPRRLWTLVETRQQIADIEQLLLGTHSLTSITREMRRRHAIGEVRTKRLLRQVRERMVAEDVEARPSNRAAAVRRYQRYIALASGERERATPEERAAGIQPVWRVKPNWPMVARFEAMLADVQGTKAPIQLSATVDVRVSQSLQAVIANITPEQMAERLLAARERREKVQRFELIQGGRAEVVA